MSEIRLRAIAQIGKISRALEKSKGGANPQATLSTGVKSKKNQLAEAGLSVWEANRYEQLAAPAAQIGRISRELEKSKRAGETRAS
jgi:hypothetical protein